MSLFIASGTVTSGMFSSGTIAGFMAGTINSGAITSTKLASGAVQSGSIASGTIDISHLSSGIFNTINGINQNLFGDGRHGILVFDGVNPVTIDGQTMTPSGNVYTRNSGISIHATSMSVAAGVILDLSAASKAAVFVQGTLTWNGKIRSNGGNGSGALPGAGGNGVGTNYASVAGGNGGNFFSGQWQGGSTSYSPFLSGAGYGGSGGNGLSGSGGAQMSFQNTFGPLSFLFPHLLLTGAIPINTTANVSLGGAGGGASSGAVGGGGGGGGGMCIVAARSIVATSGQLECIGGRGGDANQFSGSSVAGGGGGGGGGIPVVISQGPRAPINIILLTSGGAGGTGSSGGGNGLAGTANSGVIITV